MSLGMAPPLIRRFLEMSFEEQRAFISEMSAADLLRLDADFEMWAQDGQRPPKGEGWRTWLMMAGRGFGKTRAGAEWVFKLAIGKKVDIALVAASLDEARSVMVEGPAGLLSIANGRRTKLNWEPSKRELRWPRGSKATLFSGDSPDGLRGFEHHYAWCDELAKWRGADEAWMNLQMGLRGGERPRALVTTTPRKMDLLTRLKAARDTITSGGRSGDNVTLTPHFIEAMMATYGGTRIERQEIHGELMDEAEGSLFPSELIERARVAEGPEAFDMVVVGVDPPAGAGPGCDACGIVVAGRRGGRIYVLADATVQGKSPEGWARSVAGAAAQWNAGLVVAEGNQGGAMVKSVLKAADAGLPVKLVHASIAKVARAEPVALRFEAGRAFFVGVFAELEAELAGLSAGRKYDGPRRSPDRADAMVWAVTELGETRSGVPRVRRM